MELESCSALVTGGASGLGEATVRALCGRGVRCVVFDRDEARSQALTEELGGTASYVTGDVCDERDLTAALDAAADAGTFRIAVNCAGIAWAQRTLGRDGDSHELVPFTNVVNVNLIGSFNVLRLAAARIAQADALEDGERGVLVNTASIAAFEGQIGQISYAASKGGIVAMTLPAARDLAAVGIRVNTIAPGLMDTPLLGSLPEDARSALGSSVLFPRRLGRPSEFARLVVFICESPYLNGETIRLDGGLRMPPK